MENSAKAIIIAGGMFILIMVITLLVIFGRSLSSYMQDQHDKEMVKQITEFNNKFANYQGTELRGNKLISVLNRVIDYNALEAGEYGYDPVLVEINFNNRTELDSVIKFNTSSTEEKNFLDECFQNKNKPIIKNSKDKDDNLKTISQKGTTILSKYSQDDANYIPRLTDTKLQKLSAEISNIVQEQDNSSWLDGYDGDRKAVYNRTRAKKLTSILGYTVDEDGICAVNNKNILNAVKKATVEYYQFTQFKRIMFKCTSIEYSQDTGRINKMSFEVKTTTDGKIVTN